MYNWLVSTLGHSSLTYYHPSTNNNILDKDAG